jgi:peptidyl-prolyl cis-trans isomerase D
MLDFIRNRANGPVAKFIIALIIIPFAFAGVYSYLGVTNTNAVATVNGDEITLQEFDRTYRIRRQMMGENFDRYFNTDERLQQFRQNILQQIINQRLSAQAIVDMGLRTSTTRLMQTLVNDPQFQGENGFDQTMFQISLQQMGFTSSQYIAARKGDMASNQFIDALENTTFALDYELERNQRLENQSRDFDYLTINQEFFAKQVNLDDEQGQQEIEQYYQDNKARFSTPEKVSIEYILLSKANLGPKDITEEDIQQYYQDNISSFESNERRQVAHILVQIDPDATSELKTQAEQTINDIAKRLAQGEDFAKLAKEVSQDIATAEFGGDLGWIEAGMMAPEFEAAAFELVQVNTISDVVKTDFGYHIIKLLDIESGEAKPLEELREQIVESIKANAADEVYYDLKNTLSEKAFEISDTLAEAAEATGLEVKSTMAFDAQMGIGLPAELREYPQVISTAFSDDVLYQGLNSDLLDLDESTAVVLRLKEHQVASVVPLEQVKPQIANIITNQKAREATEALGESLVAQLTSGVTAEAILEQLPEGMDTNWQSQAGLTRTGTEVNAQLRNAVFQMPKPTSESNLYQGHLLASGNFAIVSLKSVNEGELPAEMSPELVQSFKDYYLQVALYHYLKQLDESADITRNLTATEQLNY